MSAETILSAHMHAHTHTRMHTHMHTCTHAHTHTHTHTHTQAPTHKHTDYKKLNLHNLKTGSKQKLETDEDSSTEWKNMASL